MWAPYLRTLVAAARRKAPGFTVLWREEHDRAKFPAVRDFAWCEDGDPPTIVTSDKLRAEPQDVAHAILAHEVAHALDYWLGAKNTLVWLREAGIPAAHLGPERRADVIGSWLAGRDIRYDGRRVQTFGQGHTPRPRHLGL